MKESKKGLKTLGQAAENCCSFMLCDWSNWIMVGAGEYENSAPIYRKTRETLGKLCLYPLNIPYLMTTAVLEELEQKGHKQAFVLPVSDPAESVRLLKTANIDAVIGRNKREKKQQIN